MGQCCKVCGGKARLAYVTAVSPGLLYQPALDWCYILPRIPSQPKGCVPQSLRDVSARSSSGSIQPHDQQRHIIVLRGARLEAIQLLEDEVTQLLWVHPTGRAHHLLQALDTEEPAAL